MAKHDDYADAWSEAPEDAFEDLPEDEITEAVLDEMAEYFEEAEYGF